MPRHNQNAEILEKLIATCHDGHQGFREAAEHVQDEELKSWFIHVSEERARFADDLTRLLGESIGEQSDRGSASGMLHRGWMDLKSALGGGDEAILSSAERGEDSAKHTYEEALQENLPADLAGVIRQQAQSVFAVHDRVRMLRDQRKAA